MDEVEFLTSLKPEVDPPTERELHAMWSSIAAGESNVDDGSIDRRRPRKRLLIAAALVLAVGSASVFVVRTRNGTRSGEGSSTVLEQAGTGGSTASFTSGVEGLSAYSSSDPQPLGDRVSRSQLAGSANAFIGRVSNVAHDSQGRALVTFEIQEWLRGDGARTARVLIDPIGWDFESEIARTSIDGSVLVACQRGTGGDVDPYATCTSIAGWSPQLESSWREALR